jgi:hypothetical protein
MSYDFQCNSFNVLSTKETIIGGNEVLVLERPLYKTSLEKSREEAHKYGFKSF